MPVWIYRIVLVIVLLISCTVELKAVWAAIDTLIAIIVFINLYALLKLYKYAKYAYLNYDWQLKNKIDEPILRKDLDIMNIDLNNYKEIVK